MTQAFGIPVDSLAVVLVAVLVGRARRGRSARAPQPRLPPARRSQRRAAGRGRSALIVAGLMLGTAIIAAALATGDTMSHTIRSAAITALGRTDEMVAAKGIDAALAAAERRRTACALLPAARTPPRRARARPRSGLVDGVAPVIVEPIAVQDVTQPPERAAGDAVRERPGAAAGFGEIRADGRTVSLADLRRARST